MDIWEEIDEESFHKEQVARDMNKNEEKATSRGHIDGYEAGREETLQNSVDQAFEEAVRRTLPYGQQLGAIAAIQTLQTLAPSPTPSAKELKLVKDNVCLQRDVCVASLQRGSPPPHIDGTPVEAHIQHLLDQWKPQSASSTSTSSGGGTTPTKNGKTEKATTPTTTTTTSTSTTTTTTTTSTTAFEQLKTKMMEAQRKKIADKLLNEQRQLQLQRQQQEEMEQGIIRSKWQQYAHIQRMYYRHTQFKLLLSIIAYIVWLSYEPMNSKIKQLHVIGTQQIRTFPNWVQCCYQTVVVVYYHLTFHQFEILVLAIYCFILGVLLTTCSRKLVCLHHYRTVFNYNTHIEQFIVKYCGVLLWVCSSVLLGYMLYYTVLLGVYDWHTITTVNVLLTFCVAICVVGCHVVVLAPLGVYQCIKLMHRAGRNQPEVTALCDSPSRLFMLVWSLVGCLPSFLIVVWFTCTPNQVILSWKQFSSHIGWMVATLSNR